MKPFKKINLKKPQPEQDLLERLDKLITVRNYISMSGENPNTNKLHSMVLRKLLTSVDNKLAAILAGEEFKSYLEKQI